MLEIISPIVLTLGLTLGVGSSTFALIFYIVALQDGVIDDSEKRFMKVVYTVLRIGMVALFLSLVGYVLSAGSTGFNEHIAQWVLLAIITVNAILMTKRKISMKVGPVLAGGSWYSLFFVTATPIGALSGITQIYLYVSWLVVFYFVFHALRRKYSRAN